MKSITIFWNWFQDNHHIIKNLINETPESQKNTCYWIRKHLGYYCREIDFLIVYPRNTKDKTEFLITSNGNPNYFHQVIDLIDGAPKLRTWKFTAQIQPTSVIEELTIQRNNLCIIPDICLKASQTNTTLLNPDQTTNKQDVLIYRRNAHILCNTESLNQAIYIILQDLLGKDIPYLKINLVQLANLPNTPEENLIHLYDLQYYIDQENSKPRPLL